MKNDGTWIAHSSSVIGNNALLYGPAMAINGNPAQFFSGEEKTRLQWWEVDFQR